MTLQQALLRIFLLVEILGAACFFITGSNGLLSVRKLDQEHAILQAQIVQEQREIEKLKCKIHDWKTNDFYKEQCAREQLQMARPDEEVYVLD